MRRARPTEAQENGGIRRQVQPAAREAAGVSHLSSRPERADADALRSPLLLRLHSEGPPVSRGGGVVYVLCGAYVCAMTD